MRQKIFRRRKRSTPIDSSININVFKMLFAHSFSGFFPTYSFLLRLAIPPPDNSTMSEKKNQPQQSQSEIFIRSHFHPFIVCMKILFIFFPSSNFFFSSLIYILYCRLCVLVLRLLNFFFSLANIYTRIL